MGNCCSSPGREEAQGTLRTTEENGQDQAGQQLVPQSVPPLLLAAGAGSLPGETPLLSHRSMGWFSAVDGGLSDDEDDWHDALSEVDLAEALEEWEAQHEQDASVQQAIKVLKTNGHLVPPEVEAAAKDGVAIAEEQIGTVVEGAPRVTVAALPPAEGLKLKRSQSQQLCTVLESPGAKELLQQAADLAVQGRVLAALSQLEQLAELAGGTVVELAALPPHAVAGALPAGTTLDLARVAAEAQLVREALQALDDHKGWMVSRNDALQVYYRHLRGTTVHSLKFAAVFDHPLEHLLAIAHEFDLIPTWNKFSIAATMLAEPTIFESYLYGAQWMIKPFKNMQGLLHARGFDLAAEHRCLLVVMEDCTPEQLPAGHKPLPKDWPKRKLVNFLPGSCFKLRPLPPAADGTPRTEGSLMLHIDPHIPFIPAFLLNFVLGVLAPYCFNQMKRVLDSNFADSGGEYSRRIAAQPQLYGLVRERMAEFVGVLESEAEAEKAAAENAEVGAGQKLRGKARSRTNS